MILLNEIIVQHTFTIENVAKFFLSPYCQVYFLVDGVAFSRVDTYKYTKLISANTSELTNLVEALKLGMSENNFVDFLTHRLNEHEPYKWISICVRAGVIE